MACKLVWGYFLPISYGIVNIERLYVHFLCTRLYEIKHSYLIQIFYKQIIFDPDIGPKRVLPLQVRVDLPVVAMSGYITILDRHNWSLPTRFS